MDKRSWHMKRRIALAVAAVAAAIALPLSSATAAEASTWRIAGYYTTAAECDRAGQAGAVLWGPLYMCKYTGQQNGHDWYELWVH